MNREIFCVKLKEKSLGLARVPYPGELGERIFNEISAAAWQNWLEHQTKLINEYRLNMLDDEARQFLETEMEKFFFGDGSEQPPGWHD